MRQILFLLGAAAFLAGPGAVADVLYTIGVPNTALGAFGGPYATTKVHLVDATHATITFDALESGGYVYLLGDGSEADVNVNASSWIISGIGGINSYVGFTPGPYSDAGEQNVSSFGDFNQAVDGFDGFTHAATEVTYTLTNTGGIWASDADVLTPNGSGYVAAVHGFACADPCAKWEGATATGYAVDGGGSVPETSGLGLLAVAGLALLVRRRFKITADAGKGAGERPVCPQVTGGR